MMNFSEEIENCLKDVRNTNNKEQNFQGRLGGNYSICHTCGKIPFNENGSLIDFQWKNITSTTHKHHKYYIIKF